MDTEPYIDTLNLLNDVELVGFCSKNPQAQKFCNTNQLLWKKRTFKKYGDIWTGKEIYKNKGNKIWSDYYVDLKKKMKHIRKIVNKEYSKDYPLTKEDIKIARRFIPYRKYEEVDLETPKFDYHVTEQPVPQTKEYYETKKVLEVIDLETPKFDYHTTVQPVPMTEQYYETTKIYLD